jgi:hypothetical protein
MLGLTSSYSLVHSQGNANSTESRNAVIYALAKPPLSSANISNLNFATPTPGMNKQNKNLGDTTKSTT